MLHILPLLHVPYVQAAILNYSFPIIIVSQARLSVGSLSPSESLACESIPYIHVYGVWLYDRLSIINIIIKENHLLSKHIVILPPKKHLLKLCNYRSTCTCMHVYWFPLKCSKALELDRLAKDRSYHIWWASYTSTYVQGWTPVIVFWEGVCCCFCVHYHLLDY